VGWLGGIRLATALADTPAANYPRPVLKTWEPSPDLSPVTITGELYGLETLPVSRFEAMTVPPVARCRHLLCGGIARFPLIDTAAPDPPIWANRQDDELPPYHRMVSTVDDLLFYGCSLWDATRGTDGFPYRMAWVPWERWEVDPDSNRILIDADPGTDQDRVILIPGPHEGLLSFGARVIRAGSTLERTAADVAARPFRVELHNTSDTDLDNDEISAVIAAARTALAANGGILYTSNRVEAKLHDTAPEQLLIAGREAIGTQVAQLAGVPAASIDAGGSGSSGGNVTYANLNTRFRELLAFGFGYYMAAISGRLSMDDVTPRGTRVLFDVEDTLRDLIGPDQPGGITG
jgi:hypothetical protein